MDTRTPSKPHYEYVAQEEADIHGNERQQTGHNECDDEEHGERQHEDRTATQSHLLIRSNGLGLLIREFLCVRLCHVSALLFAITDVVVRRMPPTHDDFHLVSTT